jgi:hypothetical protein
MLGYGAPYVKPTLLGRATIDGWRPPLLFRLFRIAARSGLIVAIRESRIAPCAVGMCRQAREIVQLRKRGEQRLGTADFCPGAQFISRVKSARPRSLGVEFDSIFLQLAKN